MPLTIPTLTDGELTLRPPETADVDPLVAACQDPEISRWTRVPWPYHREHAVEYFERARVEAAAGTWAAFLAFDPPGRLLGSLSVMEIDRERGYGEIGYWLAAGARGRGLATRAVVLLRDWAAAELSLRRIEILADRENLPSQRVAERAGFTETGELRPTPRVDPPGEPCCRVYRWTAA